MVAFAAEGKQVIDNSTNWTVEIQPGEICRRVMWNGKEVATVNSRGDFDDETEKGLAAGLAHAGRMCAMLRALLKFTDHTKPIPPHMLEAMAALDASILTMDVGECVELEDA